VITSKILHETLTCDLDSAGPSDSPSNKGRRQNQAYGTFHIPDFIDDCTKATNNYNFLFQNISHLLESRRHWLLWVARNCVLNCCYASSFWLCMFFTAFVLYKCVVWYFKLISKQYKRPSTINRKPHRKVGNLINQNSCLS